MNSKEFNQELHIIDKRASILVASTRHRHRR